MEFFNYLDFGLLDVIQRWLRCDFMDYLMAFFTQLGEIGILWIMVAVVMLFSKKWRRCGIMMGVAMILGLLCGNLILKNVIARPRPFAFDCAMLPEELLFIAKPTDWSFPSGHALASFGAATVIFLNSRRWGAAALAVASVIAFSRLYFYVHFPTDILAGILLGVVLANVAVWLVNLSTKKFPQVERLFPQRGDV